MIKTLKCQRFSQYIAGLTASLPVLSMGMVAGWSGNAIDDLLTGKLNNIPINESLLSWIISVPNLAPIFLIILSGILSDRFGRKTTILLLMIPLTIGWFLIVFANSADLVIIGRFVTGIGTGSLYSIVPIYLTEVSEREIRGKIGSFYMLFMAFGSLLSYILGYLIDIKVHTMIGALLPIVFFVIFLFQVESPIYKAKQGKYEEALSILKRLRTNSHDVNAEFQEIKLSMEANKSNKSIQEILQKRSTKLAFIISLSLVFFQQISGSIMVFFYVMEIFAASGSSVNEKQATIFIGVLRVVSTYVTSSIIELFTRKKLLLISSLFSGFGLVILGLYYTLNDYNLVSKDTLSTLSFMPVLGLCIFIVMAAFGLNNLPPIIAAELFPLEIKGFGVSIIGCFNWLFLFLISRFYINLKYAVGGDGTFYIFAGVCFTCCIFAVSALPETKGKSFEEIQCKLNNTSKTENTQV
ncbi:hypothetical protein FQR65_LT03069 [Abscondita terminalis]|nr:hypothetical protein FQR65_LT03069 [Abscondita terminalis]